MGENLPKEFGPYTLEELIARGGMAEIYRATVTGIGGFEKTVAIKKILPHLAEDDEFIAMLADEARIIESLDHANIAQVFDLGEINGSYYIAMEYIHGVDLADIVDELAYQGQRMPVPHIIHITSALCAGLHSAHSKTGPDGQPLNIVHRDISLHNVLVSFAGEVKIIDFGVAKAAGRDAKTKMGVIKGKLLYMAPEQAKAEDIDGRADLFAAGLCAYKMLTGRLPFEGDNEFQVYNNVLSKEIEPPSHFRSDVPEGLDDIVMKLLRRDPDERYQEGYAAKQDLDRLRHEVAPGYNVNRLSRYVEENFTHLIQQRGQNSNSNPASKAPATPSQPAAETGSRGAGSFSDSNSGQDQPVRQEVPAGEAGDIADDIHGEKTVAAAPASLAGVGDGHAGAAGAANSPAPQPGTGPAHQSGQAQSPSRTDINEDQTGEFDLAPDSAPAQPAAAGSESSGSSGGWVVWAIGALVLCIAGMVGYGQFAGGQTDGRSSASSSASSSSSSSSADNAAANSASERTDGRQAAGGTENEGSVRLALDTDPSGAQLLRQGEVIGETPMKISLPRSNNRIELAVRKEGFESRTFRLTPRENLEKTFKLKPSAADNEPAEGAEAGEGAEDAPSDGETDQSGAQKAVAEEGSDERAGSPGTAPSGRPADNSAGEDSTDDSAADDSSTEEATPTSDPEPSSGDPVDDAQPAPAPTDFGGSNPGGANPGGANPGGANPGGPNSVDLAPVQPADDGNTAADDDQSGDEQSGDEQSGDDQGDSSQDEDDEIIDPFAE